MSSSIATSSPADAVVASAPAPRARRRAAEPSVRAQRRRRRLWWAMLTLPLAWLALFFAAPIYELLRFSFGLSHLSRTDAIARIRGEELQFTTSLWSTMIGHGATLDVLGVDLHLPVWVVFAGIVALLLGTLAGTRIKRGGRAIAIASTIIMALPFMTLPLGNTIVRLAELKSDSQYLSLFFKSVSMAMTTSVFAVLVALPAAYFLAFCVGKSRYTWLLVVIAPFFTSFFLRIIAWKVILGANGLINSGLFSLGLLGRDHPLSFLLYSQFTVIVVLIYAWAPFAAMPMFVALENVDQRVHEAAADLGAGRLRIFFTVTLPLAAPGFVAAFLFVFIPTIGEFVTPLLVGGTKGYMFGNEISDLFTSAVDWQSGSVLAMFLLAIVVLITATTQRFLRGQELS